MPIHKEENYPYIDFNPEEDAEYDGHSDDREESPHLGDNEVYFGGNNLQQ